MASSNYSLDTLIGILFFHFIFNHDNYNQHVYYFYARIKLLVYKWINSHHNVFTFITVKATNPLIESPDPLDVASFCEKVTHEADGPQIAVKLLAYRIHSPQEKEALNALAVCIFKVVLLC